MHDFLALLGQAASPAGTGQQGFDIKGLIASPIGMMIVVIVIMYIVIFRSQSKETKRRKQLLESLKVGDKVVTSGGLHGVVAAVKDKTLMVKIADNVKVEVSRSAVSNVLPDAPATETK